MELALSLESDSMVGYTLGAHAHAHPALFNVTYGTFAAAIFNCNFCCTELHGN